MAHGHENLIPFNKRTEVEQRKIQSAGGKASGAARRRKADFRKTLNLLLTAEIDSPEWTPILEALGLDSTLESAVNAAMIKEALAGNVKAYIAIRDTLGQTLKSDLDIEEQMARTAKEQAHANKLERETRKSEGDMDEGVEIINDAPKEQEAGSDFGDIDPEVFENI